MKKLLRALALVALVASGSAAVSTPAHAGGTVKPKYAGDKLIKIDDNASVATGPSASMATGLWHLDRSDSHPSAFDGQYNHFWGYPNNVVKAYVIDSGVRSTHVELAGKVLPGWDFVENDAVSQDCYGHGTHVAGTIAGTTVGVAGDTPVKIVPLRVFDCAGVGSQATVAGALDWVLANGTKPGVVNMSLSFGAVDPYIDAKVQALIDAGFIVTVSAGNTNSDACNNTPSHIPGVLTVANSTITDFRSTTSSWGPCVDLFAPGSNITSSCFTSDTATCLKTGTSMSAPMVAGAAALYLKLNPTATPASFANWLVTLASPAHHTPNLIPNPGVGTPNKLLYLG